MRYFRIYKKLIQLSMATAITFRLSFINNLLSSAVWAVFTVLTTLLITSKTRHIFGWSPNELLLLTATYTTAWGIFNVLFSKNFNDFPNILDEGKLDTYLIKPLDSQFLLSLNRANPIAFVRIIIGFILYAFLLPSLNIQLSFQLVSGYIFLLLCGLIIMYASWFLVATLLVWFDRLSNLISLMYNVTSMANRPTEMYLKISTYLIYILPIIFISAVPTRYLLHKTTLPELMIFVSLAGITLGISILFWRYALRFYTSASA